MKDLGALIYVKGSALTHYKLKDVFDEIRLRLTIDVFHLRILSTLQSQKLE